MPFQCQNVLEIMWLVRNGSNIYFGDYGVKESLIICVHVHFSHWNQYTRTCRWSPKKAWPWRSLPDTYRKLLRVGSISVDGSPKVTTKHLDCPSGAWRQYRS